jgi:hypothetical protein
LRNRFTRATSAACRAIGTKRCRTPIPPCPASAIAIADSVTVSMLADTIGTASSIPRVNGVRVETSRREATPERRGTSSTSS